MDKLAKRLRDDAEQIEVRISPQLENRIDASLRSVSQDGAAPAKSRQSASFWWASSLTGVAATLAIVAVVNLSKPEPEPAVGITEPPPQAFSVPQFDWKPKTAMLTQTLEQELVDLQSDLKKAEQTVRDDIDDIM
jgi:hypothetical protein